jgi:hypothetical protein
MFAALRKRQLASFRYQKYLHGIGASTTHNTAMAQAGSEHRLDPMDYVGVEIEADKFAGLRQNLLALFGNRHAPKGPGIKDLLITRISSNARYTKEEVTAVFEEMFPEN